MATPLYSTVIDQINTYIIANGNNEITANVLNPILKILADFTNNNIGDLDDLTTSEKDTVVASINSLKTDFDNLVNNGVQLHTGYDDPNVTPPASYNYADFYMQLDSGDDTPIYLWQWNGIEWKNTDYIPDPFPDQNNIPKYLIRTLAEIGSTGWDDDVVGNLADYIAGIGLVVSPVEIYAFIVTDNVNSSIRQVYRLYGRGKGDLSDLTFSELYLETTENTNIIPQDLQSVIDNGGYANLINEVSESELNIEIVSNDYYSRFFAYSKINELGGGIKTNNGEVLIYVQNLLITGGLTSLKFELPIADSEAVIKIPAKPSGEYTLATIDANQIEVALPATVLPEWNGKTVIFTATGLLTIPDALPIMFNYNGLTLTGVTQTWAITSPKTFLFGTPTDVTEGQTYNFQQRGSTDSIIVLQ